MPTVDFTARNFDAIKASILNHVKSEFPDDWKNLYTSGISSAWLNIVAFVFDNLSFALDFTANECLVGETKIPLADGTEQRIDDLLGKEFHVYSYDTETGLIKPGRAFAYLRRHNAELVRVILDNGKRVDCTLDHLWMLRNGTYREACKLQVGDSLMPLYRVGKQRKNRKAQQIYEAVLIPSTGQLVSTHQLFAPDGEGKVIHHKNFNRRDNRPKNLIRMSAKEHSALHTRLGSVWQGKKRPDHAEKMRGNKFRLGIPHTPEMCRKFSRDRKGKPKPEGFGQKISAALSGIPKSEEHRLHLSESLSGKSLSTEHREHIRQGVQRRHANGETCLVCGGHFGTLNRSHLRKHDMNLSEYREAYGQSWISAHDNHKVISVEYLSKRQDVYDLSVDDYHNFALSAGVFVHNCFLPTARDRSSIIKICNLIGYKLRPPTSAAVTCTGTLTAIQAVDVVIAAKTEVRAATGPYFRTLTEQRISAGNLTGNVVFTEGQERTETFTSDGSTWQRVRISEVDAINGSIAVRVDGTLWTEVASLVLASDDSQYYSVDYDEDMYAYVQFGDDTNGAIPPVGSTISVTYRVGGGIVGNIYLNEIDTTITGTLVGGGDIQVALVNNTIRGSGGEEEETVAHAKLWAPSWVSANGRAVTENDFDVFANTFSDATYGAVAFAKAMLRQEIPELNTVDIYTWARDGAGDITEASDGLKNAMEAYFMNNGAGAIRTICTDVAILDGNNLYVDVIADIRVDSLHADAATLTAVGAALDALFSEADNIPGAAVRISKIYNAIQDATGVEHGIISNLIASYLSTEIISEAAGGTVFAATLDLEPSLPIVPGTVRVTAGALLLIDDSSSNLSGNGTGTIDYDTGDLNITFSAAPAVGTIVYASYRHVQDYTRNELLLTVPSPPINSFIGSITYPPITPFDTVTGQKGIAFTDGIQTVRDDGSGGLVDSNGNSAGTIDYDTGRYNFSFTAIPASGALIYANYDQMLRTPSEDIPVGKDQLAVKGTYTLSVITG